MNEEVNTQSPQQEEAVLPGKVPDVTLVMTAEQVLKQVEAYRANGDASSAKLEQAIEQQTQELQKLQRMLLIINAQKQLALDLYNKMTGKVEQ